MKLRTRSARQRVWVVVVGCVLLAPTLLRAEDERVRHALERFFTAEQLEADWFAPSFLQAVPFAQLDPIRVQFRGSLGDFESLRADGDRWQAVYEKGHVPVYASLDAEGRFSGLRLLPPTARADSFDEAMELVDDLAGTTSLLVLVDGEEQQSLRPDEPLAVGSAFKLVILRALREEIDAGPRAWSDVVELKDARRSLASGSLQSWPDGSPVTLHTLATLMISQSDNTATDLLLYTLGRERVEQADPSGRNRPFLATADAFRLKSPAHIEALERWRNGSEEQRRALLAEIEDWPLPSPSIFGGAPVAVDVEWFFSARELCELVSGVADLDLMGVNPGVVSSGNWARVAYKGGSEPGVLNLTTWARDESGREICVCLTQNDEEAADLLAASSAVTAFFDLLRAQAD